MIIGRGPPSEDDIYTVLCTKYRLVVPSPLQRFRKLLPHARICDFTDRAMKIFRITRGALGDGHHKHHKLGIH
jgi:hypothetical protein